MRRSEIDPIDKYIGARIRMRRIHLGISQEELGRFLGLTFQQVQKYEKGTNRVAGSRIARIARLLKVEVGFFYFGCPGSDPEAAPAAVDSPVDDFMASRDGLMIAQAFVEIADPNVRHIIAVAIGHLGRALKPKPVTLMAAE